MNQITDMHCHILPGLDDGSKSMEETMEALREASRQGITSVIATPHYYPGRYEPDAGEVLHAWRQVKQRISLEGLPLALYPGQECFYYSGLLEQLEEGEVLTLARSLYVLVEFDPECPYLQLLQGLTELQQGGYYPVLAHFERYKCLRDIQRLYELKSEVGELKQTVVKLNEQSDALRSEYEAGLDLQQVERRARELGLHEASPLQKIYVEVAPADTTEVYTPPAERNVFERVYDAFRYVLSDLKAYFS